METASTAAVSEGEQRLRERREAVTRTALVGALANLVLSGVKIAVGWVGHSHALIADGVHSLSDLATDALVWIAGHHASRAPDLEHPYGHGRYETVATLALALLLMLVALGVGWDATKRLFEPESLATPALITLYAALGSILVKEWLYWYTLAYAKRVRSDMLRANAWHHRSDAISSIVVLVGIAGTIAGLPYLDAVAAVIVAVMIARIAWELGVDAARELVDTGLDAERLAAVRTTILKVGGVRDLHMLRTRSLGGIVSTDVHVLVDPYISVSEGHLISVKVEQELKRRFDEIEDVIVHIDPEDDNIAPPTMGLPSRREVLMRLAGYWSQFPELARPERVQLHYLDGRIEVEVYLPTSAVRQADATPELAARAARALDGDPVFGRISIYAGGAHQDSAT
ncbi:MAG: cation diffusion facilitator family transporter [Thiohalocapsa sp.]|jgi:cation diffusion facilitator family transporter|uniref:cation diffusion facilitator family transporter n=1 Tax=Thiohalocapsa sp. TaxID=2497641 RepID=UPI0025D44F07|nr:cation diffusion facilitator family transporter [Thiohalocapsa sp.]MCG6941223.1 cation diffusion facilitator family transporter [Thiohalocapsa sp.]